MVLHGEQGVAVLSPKGESLKKSYTNAISWRSPISSTWTLDECRRSIHGTTRRVTGTATIYDTTEDKILGKVMTGHSPIAVGMTPDGNKSYDADFFDSTISVVDTAKGTLIKKINLLENYDPISGNVSRPIGFLPIQTPVSPNGQYVVTVNTGRQQ